MMRCYAKSTLYVNVTGRVLKNEKTHFLIIADVCLACYDGFRAPVHIVTGSAGCKEGRDHFNNNPYKWSAFRSQDYGYTKFKAYNTTHIVIEQVSVDLDGSVIDSFWLVKDKKLKFDKL